MNSGSFYMSSSDYVCTAQSITIDYIKPTYQMTGLNVKSWGLMTRTIFDDNSTALANYSTTDYSDMLCAGSYYWLDNGTNISASVATASPTYISSKDNTYYYIGIRPVVTFNL